MSQATLDPQAEARLRRRRIIISVIVVSIAVHVIGGILAGIWIVARFILATPTTFEVKKQIRIAAEEREHRMNMAEFDAARPKPSFTDKMSTARPTDFSLPDLPSLPIDTAATIDPSDGYTTVPLTGRPVCMRLVAAACSSITLWLTVRTTVTRSISGASCFKYAHSFTPGTMVSTLS